MAGNTILVVDDEQRMRKLVRDFLTKQDFNVLDAAETQLHLVHILLQFLQRLQLFLQFFSLL